MTDYFEQLGEPRRPWLDPDPLKAKFLALSQEFHPDRVHGKCASEKEAATNRYASINAAYQCLRDPKERLHHLLELERGTRPGDIQRIPPGTMDLFVQVGQTCRDADEFLARRHASSSPMAKAQLFAEGLKWVDSLQTLQHAITTKHNEIAAELQFMNATFAAAPSLGSVDRPNHLPLDRLEQLYRALSYVSRWTDQIQERLVQLSF
jgi:curved DNA-binding protein CbpA